MIWQNLRWGILYGLVCATILSLYVLALSLLRGSTRFDQYGISAGGIISAYYAGGLLAGVVLGLLRPLTKYAIGSVIAGILCGTCVYAAIGYAMEGRLDIAAALFLGTLVGGIAGLILWRRSNKPGASK